MSLINNVYISDVSVLLCLHHSVLPCHGLPATASMSAAGFLHVNPADLIRDVWNSCLPGTVNLSCDNLQPFSPPLSQII